MTNFDWTINIENLAASVAESHGKEAIEGIFARFNATCVDDLSPSHYEDVFSDLMLMDADP